MKKIQIMMLMMLVALMGMTVQSCGSDDGDETKLYTLSMELSDPGTLPSEMVPFYQAMLSQPVNMNFTTLNDAKAMLRTYANAFKSQMEADLRASGNTYKFTISYLLKDGGTTVYKMDIKVDGTTVTISD